MGKRIREARRKFKPPLTQKDLAARLELNGWKISRTTLAKIETGVRLVTDFEVVVLAKTLKVSPDWLLNEDLLENVSRREGKW